MGSLKNGRFPKTIEEAAKIVHPLELSHAAEYYHYVSGAHRGLGKPRVALPSFPQFYWDDFELKGGWKFLIGPTYCFKRKFIPRPFKEARDFVRKLQLGGQKEWYAYCRGDLAKTHGYRPKDIPTNPDKIKEYEGLFINFGDWFGTGNVSYREKKSVPYNEARKFAHTLPFVFGTEWRKWIDGKLNPEIKRPEGIPAFPDSTYKHKGWQGWSHFYGRSPLSMPFTRKSPLLSYPEFLEKLRGFNLTNEFAYDRFKKKRATWLSRKKIYLPPREKILFYYPEWEAWP